MAGRRPKPTKLKLLQGIQRSDRINRKGPAPKPEIPNCPGHIQGESRRNIPIHRQVQRTKTKSSERWLDLSPELVEALRALLRRLREELFAKGITEIPKWTFCGHTGEPFQYSNFRRRCWVPALKEAKVRQRTPHDLRHTYASQMLLAGEPLAYVSAQLGHESPEITLRVYSHWIRGSKRSATHALDSRPAENPQKIPGGVK